MNLRRPSSILLAALACAASACSVNELLTGLSAIPELGERVATGSAFDVQLYKNCGGPGKVPIPCLRDLADDLVLTAAESDAPAVVRVEQLQGEMSARLVAVGPGKATITFTVASGDDEVQPKLALVVEDPRVVFAHGCTTAKLAGQPLGAGVKIDLSVRGASGEPLGHTLETLPVMVAPSTGLTIRQNTGAELVFEPVAEAGDFTLSTSLGSDTLTLRFVDADAVDALRRRDTVTSIPLWETRDHRWHPSVRVVLVPHLGELPVCGLDPFLTTTVATPEVCDASDTLITARAVGTCRVTYRAANLAQGAGAEVEVVLPVVDDTN